MPSFAEAFRVWLRIGLLSFGGPAGQIALLHREVVEGRRWIGERRFLHALNFCTLLPGPEAQQLATYLGWLMHGVRGGLAAGLLFVLPGAAVMLALSLLYATVGDVPLIAALFFGLKCAVLVLVVEALLRIGRRALKGRAAWALAAVAFAGLFLFGVPFPLVVLAAGVVGNLAPGAFAHTGHGAAKGDVPALIDAVLAADPGRPARLAAGARRAGMAALVVWLLPVAVLAGAAPWHLRRRGPVLLQDGRRHRGRRLCRARLRRPGRGAVLRLAFGAGDAGRPRPCRDYARAVDPGAAIRRLPGRLPGARDADRGAGRDCRLGADALGHVRAVLRIRVPRRSPGGAPPGQPGALRRPLRHHRGGGRRRGQPRHLWFALRVLFRELRPLGAGPLAVELPVPASLDPAALALAVLAAVCLFRLKLGVVRALGVTAAAGVALHLTGVV